MASGSCDLWRHRRLWTVAYRLWACETLQQPLIGKREIARGTIADNHMVEHPDAERLAREHELACQQTIFFGRGAVATGVIVATNDGGGVAQDGRFVDFPGVHDRGGEAPHGHHVEANDAVFLIDHGDQKMLAIGIVQVGLEQAGHVLGTAELWPLPGQTGFADEGDTIGRNAVGPGGTGFGDGKEAGLLRCRGWCSVHGLVSFLGR